MRGTGRRARATVRRAASGARHGARRAWWLVPILALPCGCGDAEVPLAMHAQATVAVLDAGADLDDPARFFDLPWPLDARLDDAGRPEVAGWPNPVALESFEGLRRIAGERRGFPTVPVAYLRFTGALPPMDPTSTQPLDATAPIVLADVDPGSPAYGARIPIVAGELPADAWTPSHVLAVAPRPGFVLRPATRYAVVVRRGLGDGGGAPLGVAPEVATLLRGGEPGGERGARVTSAVRPLLQALPDLDIDADDVAAATVFTTGEVVAEMAALGDAVVAAHPVTVSPLALDPDDGAGHERFCELRGAITYPQLQAGQPPFATGGSFVVGDDGLPLVQRRESAPLVITVPRTPMPRGGYPLLLYMHGSGGLAAQVVDRGPFLPDGTPEPGKGPAHVVAAFGMAAAASALPVNPERLPGASDIAYLNIDNLAAFRDTFRQGVIEQRLLLDALRTLTIAPEALAGCAGPSLPTGETHFRFASEAVAGMGQSMGALYLNLVAPTEPRLRAVVPTGGGGFWSYFLLETALIPGARGLLALLLDTEVPLSFAHPALALLELAWEPAEPIAYVPFIARRPLPGHPARPIYEPVGEVDSYFPTSVYDAMALAYGNELAGEAVWPTMGEALALDGRGQALDWPVSQNLLSEGGAPYTGVVAQFRGSGEHDAHDIAFQDDAVKTQYACFLETLLARGVATVPAPGVPCR